MYMRVCVQYSEGIEKGVGSKDVEFSFSIDCSTSEKKGRERIHEREKDAALDTFFE